MKTMPADAGLSLSQAALLAGFGLLVIGIAAPYAQFYIFPTLLVEDSVEKTIANLTERRGLLLTGIMSYLTNYVFDIIVAGAFYVLLAPVNRFLSLLAFIFVLIYTAVALAGVLNYVEAFRLMGSTAVISALGSEALHHHIYLLMSNYQFDWGFSLILFGIVLLLRGYLVLRAPYIPAIFGVLLIIAGIGYIGYILALYYVPDLDVTLLAVTFLAEPVFMVWLLLFGWRIKDPSSSSVG